MKKMLLIVIILIIVIAVIGLIYILTRKPVEPPSSEGQINKLVVASPKEVYLALKAEADAAQDLDSFIAVYEKYSTKAFFQESNAQIQAIPADQRAQFFATMKSFMVPLYNINIDTIVEDITGDTAVITAYSKDSTAMGTVKMAKEDGIWKVNAGEEWGANIGK